MDVTDPREASEPAATGRPGTAAPLEDAGRPVAAQGLTRAEVADRVARGLVNDVPEAPTRTVGQILRANVLTPFNLLLGSLLAVILVVGPRSRRCRRASTWSRGGRRPGGGRPPERVTPSLDHRPSRA